MKDYERVPLEPMRVLVTAIRRPGRRTRFLVGCGPVGYSDCAGEAACQLIHDLSVGWQAGHEAAGRHL